MIDDTEARAALKAWWAADGEEDPKAAYLAGWLAASQSLPAAATLNPLETLITRNPAPDASPARTLPGSYAIVDSSYFFQPDPATSASTRSLEDQLDAGLLALNPELRRDRAEIARLREDCAEFYQVIGCLAEMAGVFDTDAVNKALDNALAASEGDPRPHADLLPYCFPPAPTA